MSLCFLTWDTGPLIAPRVPGADGMWISLSLEKPLLRGHRRLGIIDGISPTLGPTSRWWDRMGKCPGTGGSHVSC